MENSMRPSSPDVHRHWLSAKSRGWQGVKFQRKPASARRFSTGILNLFASHNIVCFVGFYSARRGLDGNLRKTFNNSGVERIMEEGHAVSGVHYPPETVGHQSRVLDECMATLINGHPRDPTTLRGCPRALRTDHPQSVAEQGGGSRSTEAYRVPTNCEELEQLD